MALEEATRLVDSGIDDADVVSSFLAVQLTIATVTVDFESVCLVCWVSGV
jgi:hypothetical protein